MNVDYYYYSRRSLVNLFPMYWSVKIRRNIWAKRKIEYKALNQDHLSYFHFMFMLFIVSSVIINCILLTDWIWIVFIHLYNILLCIYKTNAVCHVFFSFLQDYRENEVLSVMILLFYARSKTLNRQMQTYWIVKHVNCKTFIYLFNICVSRAWYNVSTYVIFLPIRFRTILLLKLFAVNQLSSI